jgi:hypothetical protein
VEPLAITGLLLRRAVLGTLLAAARPLTVREVVEALAAAGATTSPHLSKAPNRVLADLLAHQARIGKVRRVAPGTYAVVPDSMSRSTRRRCRVERRREGVGERYAEADASASTRPLRAGQAGGRDCVASSHHDMPLSIWSRDRDTAGAVRGSRSWLFATVFAGVGHRGVQVLGEAVHHARHGVRPGDAEVQGGRVLQAVHAPLLGGERVVHVEDVDRVVAQLLARGGGVRHVEERVAEHPQLGVLADDLAEPPRRSRKMSAAIAR